MSGDVDVGSCFERTRCHTMESVGGVGSWVVPSWTESGVAAKANASDLAGREGVDAVQHLCDRVDDLSSVEFGIIQLQMTHRVRSPLGVLITILLMMIRTVRLFRKSG